MHRCKGVGGRHAETRSRGSVCARCRSCHRFTRPGVIPTSTPHMDRLLGPQGIGQAGSDKVDTDEADEVIVAVAKTVAKLTSQQHDPAATNRRPDDAIISYDAEFRREEATSAVGSHAKH